MPPGLSLPAIGQAQGLAGGADPAGFRGRPGALQHSVSAPSLPLATEAASGPGGVSGAGTPVQDLLTTLQLPPSSRGRAGDGTAAGAGAGAGAGARGRGRPVWEAPPSPGGWLALAGSPAGVVRRGSGLLEGFPGAGVGGGGVFPPGDAHESVSARDSDGSATPSPVDSDESDDFSVSSVSGDDGGSGSGSGSSGSDSSAGGGGPAGRKKKGFVRKKLVAKAEVLTQEQRIAKTMAALDTSLNKSCVGRTERGVFDA